LHDVGIGDDVAVGADHEAGAEALLPLRPLRNPFAEEVAEELVE